MGSSIATYREQVKSVLDRYLLLYNKEYPGHKTDATAKAFLLAHNTNYRNEVAAIAIQTIRDNTHNDLIDEILALNDLQTVKLSDELMGK